MGLWPTHRDESALLRFIDSKRVTSRLSTEYHGTLNARPPGYCSQAGSVESYSVGYEVKLLLSSIAVSGIIGIMAE